MRRTRRTMLLVGLVALGGCSDADLEEACTPSGGDFPQPELRCSSGGALDTTLTAEIGRNAVRNNFPPGPGLPDEVPIEGPTYEGTLMGPTFRVRPGDHLRIDFRNRLPENPESRRCGDLEHCAFPHDPYTTNFHTHGLTVTPLGISDNILRLFEPGLDYPIDVPLPDDHPAGTFWYHPHKHGTVSFQFFGGMAGFLIVEGGADTIDAVPAVAAAKDVVMGFQLLRTDLQGKIPFVNEDALFSSSLPAGPTVNGNCTDAPFKRCIGPFGATGDLCESHSDCPADAECVGKSCRSDADCSDADSSGGTCGKWCNLAGAPTAMSVPCTRDADCPGESSRCSGWSAGCTRCGLWSPLQPSYYFLTTNGETNPTLHMRPGEVQRWRLLNAAAGVLLPVALKGTAGAADLPMHVIAQDGLTLAEMVTLAPGTPYVMGAGNRVDVLVRAGEPGTYQLQVLDPSCACVAAGSCPGDGTCTSPGKWPISLSRADPPAPRQQRIGFGFQDNFTPGRTRTPQVLTYPLPLVTIEVAGESVDMDLPAGPLPVPESLPSVETMLATPPDARRRVAFELCGLNGQPRDAFANMGNPDKRLPSCGWFFERYDASYWGGTDFKSLMMMRDADDVGIPSDANPAVKRVDYQKEGLFHASRPLFEDMRVGNFEEWTVYNRTFSDHPFHIHQNPFLLTHVNGVELPVPEWRDTITVPAAEVAGTQDLPPEQIPGPGTLDNIFISNECIDGRQNPDCDLSDPGSPTYGRNCCVNYGRVRFRTYFAPETAGKFVMHCHILTHEDLGMMQLLELKE